MSVTVESHRNTVFHQMMFDAVQIALSRFRFTEISIGKHTGGVINEGYQTTSRIFFAKPTMGAAIDLNQLSKTLSATS